MNPDVELIDGLAETLVSAIADTVSVSPSRCALLDFPNHNNVGDNAIWAGERLALRRAGYEVVYVADLSSYREVELRRRLPRGATVFLHGGGNLGTIWPAHQRFREKVAASLRDYSVVQLPQSVHFEQASALQRWIEIVSSHPNFQVWVRDVESHDALSALGDRVSMLPDSAFVLGALPRPSSPVVDVLALSRTDHERNDDIVGEHRGVDVVDWLVGEPGRPWMHTVHRVTVRTRETVNQRLRQSDFLVRVTEPLRRRAFDRLAELRIARGCRTLSRGRAVVTDRLHAHILCVLMGIPHVCVDNKYGKISRYHDAFTRASRCTWFASSFEQAVQMARELG